MSNNFPTQAPLALLASLFLSSNLNAADTAADSGRWRCQVGPQGEWQCDSVTPAAGTGTRFIPAEKPAKKPEKTQPEADIKQEVINTDYRLDWVSRDALPDDIAQLVPSYCAGAYVEPDYVDSALLDLDPQTQPLKGSSDSSQSDVAGRTTLTGDVVISQGYRQIKSDQAILDRTSNTAVFPGTAHYREPGMLLIGEDTQINMQNNEVAINNAVFVSHQAHMRGTAGKLAREESGIVHVQNGAITYCKPGANTWELAGSELTLNQDTGVGTIKHARLRVKDVPVLYFPYMEFPIDDRRKSGFLIPQIGSSDGFDVAAPYYLNIAPNYDATLTPRYIADRGVMGEAEFRYLHDNNTGVLGGAYLINDDLFDGQDRWLAVAQHDGTVFNRFQTKVDYSSVSDKDYLSDLGTDLNTTSQTHLLRLAQASYNSEFWSLTTRVQNYQTLDESITDDNKPYERLPQILFQSSYPIESSGLELGLTSEYSYFDRDNDNLTGLDRAVGSRTRIEPRVSWLFETPYAFIKPSATYKLVQYALDELPGSMDDSPDISVPVFSLDSGLFFERDTNWGNTPLVQTFEPRLFYLNVPEEKNQQLIPVFDTSELDFSYNQLFREDRFVGSDRVGDAEQLSLGLTTRFIENTGFERARASLGQIFYFEDRKVTLEGAPLHSDNTSESAYAAELMYALKSGWRLQGDLEWDPDTSSTTQSSINLRYHGDNQHLFNIGYRTRNDDRTRQIYNEKIEQTDVSLIWPVSDHWSFISRWNQDLIQDRVVEAFAGLEYQSCCWSVRFVGRHWINDDDLSAANKVDAKNAFYIQFQLKGLGGIGSSLDDLFSDSIAGYQEL